MWRSQAVFSKQTPRFSLLLEPVLKAQDPIYSTNRTDDWGYKHHKVTLGHVDTKLCGVISTLEGKDETRGTLRIEGWVCANLMKFNKAKCKVLGQGNPKHKNRLGREWALRRRSQGSCLMRSRQGQSQQAAADCTALEKSTPGPRP
ncbi:hypothetical protein DUI87_12875 [Hirundo rustica rustica]|uniref:Uncharacterized protein n=1 Tax=Hirundo rustica rustica TaxID=333673 RepID=A0A3M0KSG8_HIRRU|nr:hypothetical protein DUI87_12875 [Hirundo rustica rustica]